MNQPARENDRRAGEKPERMEGFLEEKAGKEIRK